MAFRIKAAEPPSAVVFILDVDHYLATFGFDPLVDTVGIRHDYLRALRLGSVDLIRLLDQATEFRVDR